MSDIQTRDLQHIWHPCSQMKDYETFPPIEVTAAKGSYLTLADGRKIIDANASWWCKSLGHGHPALTQALVQQAQQFEHVIFANTTHQTIVSLSEKLASLTDNLNKVFYAGDGSCAVEIALKMSLHAQLELGRPQRNQFAALRNGYHGETIFALGMGDLGLYNKPYESVLPPVTFLEPIPYVHSQQDPLWQDCSDYWPAIESQLNEKAACLAGIIVEPILQGAGGMQVYSADLLRRLRHWSRKNHVYLIADECMTGLGRTGQVLACDHANITPDFLCLSKNLTSGYLPFSAVLTSNSTYELFYGDYESGKAFMHSHTYSGHALGAAVALACLNTMEQENIYGKLEGFSQYLLNNFMDVAESTGKLTNIRHIGGLVAGDLIPHPGDPKRLGYAVYQEAVKQGAMLRPLGNTIYWLPPLNTDETTIQALRDITINSIKAVCG